MGWIERVAALLLVALLLAAPAAAGDGLFEMGQKAYGAGRYQEALDWFRAAVREDARDGALRLWLGMAHYKLGQVEEARLAFLEARRLAPRTEIATSADRNLAVLEAASRRPPVPAAAGPEDLPPGTPWTRRGAVTGLAGDDWFQRAVGDVQVFAPGDSRDVADHILKAADRAYTACLREWGFRPSRPPRLFILPPDRPAARHPMLAGLGRSGKSGVRSVPGTRLIVVQLGGYSEADIVLGDAGMAYEMCDVFATMVPLKDRGDYWDFFQRMLVAGVDREVQPYGTPFRPDHAARVLKATAPPEERSWARLYPTSPQTSDARDFQAALTTSVREFLVKRYGADVLARIVKASRGKDLQEGFQEACGESLERAEHLWADSIGW